MWKVSTKLLTIKQSNYLYSFMGELAIAIPNNILAISSYFFFLKVLI